MDSWTVLKEAINTNIIIEKEVKGILDHRDQDGYRPIDIDGCPAVIIDEMIAMGADNTGVDLEELERLKKKVNSYQ